MRGYPLQVLSMALLKKKQNKKKPQKTKNKNKNTKHKKTKQANTQTNLAVCGNTGEDIPVWLVQCTLLLSSLHPISFPLLESFPICWVGMTSPSGWPQTEVDQLALLFSTLTHGVTELSDLGKRLDVSIQGFLTCQKRMTYSSILLDAIPVPHVFIHPVRHDGYMLRPCLAEVSLASELTL